MGNKKEADKESDPGAQPVEPGTEEKAQGETFDAVAAAAEFEAALSDADQGAVEVASAEQYARMLESDIESMTSLLAQKELVAKRAVERADRAVEEVELSKQRLGQEMDRQVERRVRDVLRAFVGVLDDLDRAISSAREMDHNPEVVAGVELVRKSFLGKLGTFGVEHQAAVGEPFDPNQHEAVSTTAVSDDEQDGKITAVFREGYLIGDEVLRPAMVVVGKRDK